MDAPEKICIPSHSSCEVGGTYKPDVDYIRADLYEQLQQENAEFKKSADSWKKMVGMFLSTIPTSEDIRVSGTVGESIEYFKRLHRERDNLKVQLQQRKENEK